MFILGVIAIPMIILIHSYRFPDIHQYSQELAITIKPKLKKH